MAGDAEHRGERIEGGEGRKADRRVLRQEDVERGRSGADVDHAERHLPQGEERPGQPEVADDRRAAPAHDARPRRDRATSRPIAERPISWFASALKWLISATASEVKMKPTPTMRPMPSQNVMPATIVRLAMLPAVRPGRRVEPVADRAAGHQREAEGERDRVAGERGERRQPVGNLDVEVAEREPVVAGQREIAQRGEAEGHQDLVAAGRREGRLELARGRCASACARRSSARWR